MAITFVSGSSVSNSTSASSIVVPPPAGIVAGNLLVAIVFAASSSSSPVFSAPAGWIPAGPTVAGTGTAQSAGAITSANGGGAVFTRIATSSETSATFTGPAWLSASIVQYSGTTSLRSVPSLNNGNGPPTSPSGQVAARTSDVELFFFGSYNGVAFGTPANSTLVNSSRSAANTAVFVYQGSALTGKGAAPTFTDSTSNDFYASGTFLLVDSADPPWLHKSLVQAPRNGTTSHTVSFTPATAGSLLVAIGTGAVTFTTPTGWSLPSGGSAVNNAGLYVWYKTATSGESSFSTTHNASNYPAGFIVYEFASGSTFGSSASFPNTGNAGSVNLTGQTGTSLFIGASGMATASSVGTYTTTWNTGVTDADVFALASGTDGYTLGVAYVEDSTATSFASAATIAAGGGAATINMERLSFSVKVAAGGPTTLNNVKSGTVTVSTAFVGTTGVSKMYAGTVQVFP